MSQIISQMPLQKGYYLFPVHSASPHLASASALHLRTQVRYGSLQRQLFFLFPCQDVYYCLISRLILSHDSILVYTFSSSNGYIECQWQLQRSTSQQSLTSVVSRKPQPFAMTTTTKRPSMRLMTLVLSPKVQKKMC